MDYFESFLLFFRRTGRKIRVHDLRHTSATLLLSANVHPKVVQERLGHAPIVLTMDTYSSFIPTMQDESAEKMNLILGTPYKEKLI